jgi:hypothetical protein
MIRPAAVLKARFFGVVGTEFIAEQFTRRRPPRHHLAVVDWERLAAERAPVARDRIGLTKLHACLRMTLRDRISCARAAMRRQSQLAQPSSVDRPMRLSRSGTVRHAIPIAECETIYLDRLYVLLTQRLGNLTGTLRSRRRF